MAPISPAVIVFFGVGAAEALSGADCVLTILLSFNARPLASRVGAASFIRRSLAGAAAAALLGKIAPYVVGPPNNPATFESVSSMSYGMVPRAVLPPVCCPIGAHSKSYDTSLLFTCQLIRLIMNGIYFSQQAFGSLSPAESLTPGFTIFPFWSNPYHRIIMRYCAAV